MLKLEDVFKSYRSPVVRGVDLEAHSGEVLGLLGPNGAGKSTTLRIAAGRARADRGRVYLAGTDVTAWPLHRRALAGLGLLCQEPSVFRDLSVGDNLVIVLERQGLSRPQRSRRLGRLLDEVGLSPFRDQRARTLSGGQRRRLEVARALAARPKVLLLDEPFAGLDPIAVADLAAVIDGLRQRGLALILSDHEANAVLRCADRVCLMHQGRVVCRGRPAEVARAKLAREVYLGDSLEWCHS
jgi:lipopolysaccharide export system ATP-binding protein